MTTIEWTQRTWNPVRGCSRVSPGCDNCYAMRQAHRFSGNCQPYEGLTTIRRGKVDWTGSVRFVPEQLQQPLRVRRPTAFFVNSMSDLFHESLTNEEIAAVFGVMTACPQHTFQILTKRPKRMRAWFEWLPSDGLRWTCMTEAIRKLNPYRPALERRVIDSLDSQVLQWPLPNVWLGVSCEDQARADERIPLLLETPAVVRFISAEPLLGPIDLRGWGDHAPSADLSGVPETWEAFAWPEWVPVEQRKLIEDFWKPSWGRGPREWLRDHVVQRVPASGARVTCAVDRCGWADVNKMAHVGITGRYLHCWNNIGRIVTDDGSVVPAAGGIGSGWLSRWLTPNGDYQAKLSWVIAGGESGPGARPCDVEWIRSIVRQCREAGTACFVKQLGSRLGLRHPKGGDSSEWPEDLRVREMPEA